MKRFALFFALALCLISVGCNRKSDVPGPVDDSVGNANQVSVETSQGSFVIQLNSSVAPITAENFIKNVESGTYNNTLIHEVLDNCIVMMGRNNPPMGVSDSQTIKNESSALNPNKKWTVAAMHAPSNTQSDSMQILINMVDNPELDFVAPGTTPDTCGYCVFGEVVSGREVLEKINKTPVQVQGDFEFAPVPPITIIKMTRGK